jgi:hypothetical protein
MARQGETQRPNSIVLDLLKQGLKTIYTTVPILPTIILTAIRSDVCDVILGA